jgi:hypothetical protein
MREAKDSMSGSMRWRDSAMRRVLRHRIGGRGAEGERRRRRWPRGGRRAEPPWERASRGGAMAARRALPRSRDGDARRRRRRRGTGEAQR